MRYATFQFGEVARLVGNFDTGDTDITIQVFDLASPASPIALGLESVADGGILEVGSTGDFVWPSSEITVPPTVLTQYEYVMTRASDNRVHKGKWVVGGFPDHASIAQYKGAIWYSASGVGGTALGDNGTPTNPSNSAADILTLAGLLNVSEYRIVDGTLTLGAAHNNWKFVGEHGPASDAVDVNGQDCDGSSFASLSIAGTLGGVFDGDLNGRDVVFAATGGLKSGPNASAWDNVRFVGDCVCFGSLAEFAVKEPSTGVESPMASLSLNGSSIVQMRGLAGNLLVKDCVGGLLGLTLDGAGVFLDSSNTSGIVNISGIHSTAVSNNSSISAGTFNDRSIPAAAWDQVLANHLTAGTTGAKLNATTVAGDSMALTAGAVDDIWNELLSGHTIAGSGGDALTQLLNGTVSRQAIDITTDPWELHTYIYRPGLATDTTIHEVYELFDQDGVAIAGNDAAGNNPLADSTRILAERRRV